MWPSDEETELLTDYLLGRLSEEERHRVEHEYLADESRHEQLIAIESELIDCLVCGELSLDEGEYLTGNLGPHARNDRLSFARVLAHATDRLQLELQSSSLPKRWYESPADTLIYEPPLAVPITPPTIDAVLSPVERDTSHDTSVIVPSQRPEVTLQLRLDADEYPAYVAKIGALNGSWSVTISGLHADINTVGKKILLLRLDSSQLKPGDYKVSVSGLRASTEDPIAGYLFRVST